MTAAVAGGATDHRGRPRVAVTGLGVKTPAGQTVDELWDTLLAARPAAGPITLYDASEHSVGFACEVRDFDPVPYVGPKEVRRTDRAALLAVAAAADALADAAGANGAARTPDGDQLVPAPSPDDLGADSLRCAVVAGSGIGGIRTLEDQIIGYAEKGPSRVGPFLVPMMMPNAAAGSPAPTWPSPPPAPPVPTPSARAPGSCATAWPTWSCAAAPRRA